MSFHGGNGMAPLSMDLRLRIVAAYNAGEGSYSFLASRFAVSKAVVGKLVRQQRNLGTLESQMQTRGRKRAIQGDLEQRLQEHVEQNPDATLKERIADLGLGCSVNTMSLSLARLGHSFKKVGKGR